MTSTIPYLLADVLYGNIEAGGLLHEPTVAGHALVQRLGELYVKADNAKKGDDSAIANFIDATDAIDSFTMGEEPDLKKIRILDPTYVKGQRFKYGRWEHWKYAYAPYFPVTPFLYTTEF